MAKEQVEITPSTTVGALLDAHPELEETLIGIAPPFKKLKNPFLRKSVAKVATLKHIASVGNVPLNELISKLSHVRGDYPSGYAVQLGTKLIDEDTARFFRHRLS